MRLTYRQPACWTIWNYVMCDKRREFTYVIMYNNIWANQKTKSFVYRWLQALAMFDVNVSTSDAQTNAGNHYVTNNPALCRTKHHIKCCDRRVVDILSSCCFCSLLLFSSLYWSGYGLAHSLFSAGCIFIGIILIYIILLQYVWLVVHYNKFVLFVVFIIVVYCLFML